ncbi:MAG: BF3164 family lipoprotein [bacterium]
MKNICTLLCLFFLFSCSSDRDYDRNLSFGIQSDLKYRRRDISPEFLIATQDMAIIDSLLIIEDFVNRDYSLLVFNRFSYQHKMYLGKKGNGPNEIINPRSELTISASNNSFHLFDANSRRFFSYKVLKNGGIESTSHSFKSYKDEAFVLSLIKVKDYYVATGMMGDFKHNRFLVFDKRFELVNKCNGYPYLSDGIPHEHKSGLLHYNNSYEVKPDGTKIVFGTYIGATMEIFDVSNLPYEIKSISEVNVIPPIYVDIPGPHGVQVQWDDESILGFEDIFCTDNYIYTVINGRSGDDEDFPNTIKVFDWNGKPIKQYNLNCGIVRLAVDEVNGIIYAVGVINRQPTLIEFDMHS